jgi:hypothetical protein
MGTANFFSGGEDFAFFHCLGDLWSQVGMLRAMSRSGRFFVLGKMTQRE